MKRYYFKEISACEMCNDSTSHHKVIGQRLNQSQGLNPKSKVGISVTVQKCSKCGLIYSNPQPIPFDLQDHYGALPEQYWKDEYFAWKPEYFSAVIDIVKRLTGFKEGMKSLDIGAGLGKAMLSMEKAGFDVYGLEASIPFYDRAVSKMNIDKKKLKQGAVEGLEYESEYFDFISFGAVFEHLHEPSKCLEKAMRWLKPNGIIYIVVPSSKWLIPKIANLYFRLIGTNFVTNLSPMHMPFHTYEFDLKSFEYLAQKLNYKIEMSVHDVCPVNYAPGILQPLLRKYMKATKTGMQLTVFLRKMPLTAPTVKSNAREQVLTQEMVDL